MGLFNSILPDGFRYGAFYMCNLILQSTGLHDDEKEFDFLSFFVYDRHSFASPLFSGA